MHNIRTSIDLIEELLTERYIFDPETFIDKVRGVANLMHSGDPGDKVAAKAAFDRLMKRAQDESKDMTPAQRDQFSKALDKVLNRTSSSSSSEPSNDHADSMYNDDGSMRRGSNAEARFHDGQWVVNSKTNTVGKIVSAHQSLTDEYYYSIKAADGTVARAYESHLRLATQEEIDRANAGRPKATKPTKRKWFWQ